MLSWQIMAIYIRAVAMVFILRERVFGDESQAVDMLRILQSSCIERELSAPCQGSKTLLGLQFLPETYLLSVKSF